MQLALFERMFQVGNFSPCVRAGGRNLLPLALECRSGPFVFLVGELAGGAVRRSLGVLSAADDVVERHPEDFLGKVRCEVALNIRSVLQVRWRRLSGTGELPGRLWVRNVPKVKG